MGFFRLCSDLQKDSCSQYLLGDMYYEGTEVHQDYASAFRLYEKAAGLGYHTANYKLAWMYYEGKGVRHDRVVWHSMR